MSVRDWDKENFSWSKEVREALKVLKLENFRGKQLQVINASAAGHDVLGLMPTGCGKSLIYQILGMVLPGVVFIICPLLSLITDQMEQLRKMNLTCDMINSQNFGGHDILLEKLKSTEVTVKFVFITAESLQKDKVKNTFKTMILNGTLQRFVIDEVHCVSQWGNQFRPDYSALDCLKKDYPKIPLLMLTASATLQMKTDILNMLGLKEISNENANGVLIFQSPLYNPNLKYSVVAKSAASIDKDIFDRILKNNYEFCSGIIYCFSKKDCEDCAEALNKHFELFQYRSSNAIDKKQSFDLFKKEMRVYARAYHAETQNREDIQKYWTVGRIHVICATIAFGMGINKPDVRFVYHRTVPNSIEHYYQESGRAGRDGKTSDCCIFYAPADVNSRFYMIENQNDNNKIRVSKNFAPVTEEVIKRNKEALKKLKGYCENSMNCRRILLSQYFNILVGTETCKDNFCDNCLQQQGFQSSTKAQTKIDQYFSISNNNNKRFKT